MANRTDRPLLPHLSRAALLAAGGALLLTACTTDQQATTARPAVQANDELGALMRVAALTRQSGDFDTAAALYRRAHQIDPRDPLPLIELARLLDDNGAPTDAALLWQDALRLVPDDPAVLGGYGVTLARLGQPEQAVGYLDRVTKAAPTAQTWNALGVVRDQLGDAAGAQSAYRAGLALEPNEIRLANNLGLSLALAGRHDEALAMLEQIALRSDATPRHRQNLALAYALAGQDALAARIGAMDADPIAARRSAMQYASIAALPDHASRVAAVATIRAGEAAPARPDVAAEAAALVRGRQQAAKPPVMPESRVTDRITPMVTATRLEPAGPAAPKPATTTATPSDLPVAAAPVASASSAGNTAATPVTPVAPIPAAPPATAAASTAASAGKPLPERAPHPEAAMPAAFDPATPARTYRPALVAVAVPDSAPPAPAVVGDVAFDPATVPQTFRPDFVAAATPTAPAAVPAIARPAMAAVSSAASGGGFDPTTAPQSYRPPFAAVPLADAGNVQGDARHAPAASVAELIMSSVAEVEPALPRPADGAAVVADGGHGDAARDAVAAWPLALAGVAVPSVEDRLIVAASAYHAGVFDFAATIWQPLADAGVVQAKFHLGALYYEGRGVERDLAKAYTLLREAELAGFADARIVLALIETRLPDAERRKAEARVAAARP